MQQYDYEGSANTAHKQDPFESENATDDKYFTNDTELFCSALDLQVNEV
jgi:hypothetical protein